MPKKLFFILFGVWAFVTHTSCSSGAAIVSANNTRTFYVDAVKGSDNNEGSSPEKAFQTLAKINSISFLPADNILFKSGQQWQGQLHPKGSGMDGAPIVIDKYGGEQKPIINGGGIHSTVRLQNQQYWEINNLEITNYNPVEENGINLKEWEIKNTTDYFNAALPPKAEKNNTPKLGISIEANDIGAVKHIYLKNLLVHGVNGTIIPDGADENGDSKNNGGIGFDITGTNAPTWFENILVENCVIRDVDRTGLFTKSSWNKRTLHKNENWTPSKNIVIRKNTFERSGANALIVRVADAPLIEYNLFHQCAIKGSGNAAFNFNTDNAVWQYNECRFTKANEGDNDAGGIDSDYRTKNTIIQYNWLHDNDFGMLVTGGGGQFNDGTVVRYNIIERDGKQEHRSDKKRFIFKVSGGATNTQIYNNTIYIDPTQQNTFLVFHKKWSVWPTNTFYYNNIFLNEDDSAAVSLGESKGNIFENNIIREHRLAELDNIKTGEINPVAVNSGPQGYKLKKGSAALRSGKIIENKGGKDYYGNFLQKDRLPNIGAYDGDGL